MRKVREVLWLYHAAELSIRAVARSVGVSPTTAGDYVHRVELQELTWPLPESVDDAALQRRLLMSPTPPKETPRPLLDWGEIHRELRRKGVTLTLLWQEYKAAHPEGLQYSQFCELDRALRVEGKRHREPTLSEPRRLVRQQGARGNVERPLEASSAGHRAWRIGQLPPWGFAPALL